MFGSLAVALFDSADGRPLALLLTLVMGTLAWRTVEGLLTVKASREVTMIVGFPVWLGYAAIVPSLVLATAVGLIVARVALGFGLSQFALSDALPFWIDDSLSWRTVLYAGVLALFGALIVGVLPALRVTRVNIQDALRSEGAGRTLKFGRLWTSIIVVQVAITVAFLPIAAGGVFESNRFNQRAAGIGAALAGAVQERSMLTCRACEQLGVRTVAIVAEMGGLTDHVPEADAIVIDATERSLERGLSVPSVDVALGNVPSTLEGLVKNALHRAKGVRVKSVSAALASGSNPFDTPMSRNVAG